MQASSHASDIYNQLLEFETGESVFGMIYLRILLCKRSFLKENKSSYSFIIKLLRLVKIDGGLINIGGNKCDWLYKI